MHRLRCFGRLAIENDGGERIQLRSRKHLALLVYLAAHRDRLHERGRVARLFWDTEPDLARHSLSQALYDLGKHLPGLDLDRTNREVGLGPDGLIYEGQEFEEAVREDRLGEAVRLYDGPFAPDLETVGGPDLERWVERERTRFRSLAEKALLRRVTECADAGRWGEMVVAGNRLVDMNPLREKAHRAVMKGLWLRGDRSAALAHFEEHEDFLDRESPGGIDAETRELVEKIRTADRDDGTRSVHERPRPEMVGREEEFRVLKDALDDVLDGESRFIVIRGEAGIGKTRLLEEFAEVAALEDVRLLESRCYAAESDVPYGPIVDGLKEFARGAAESAEAEGKKFYQLGHLFPEAFGEPEPEGIYTSAEAGTHRLAEEFVTLVGDLTSTKPLVWLVDDTHWIDRASQTLLNYAAARCSNLNIMVLHAARPGESSNVQIESMSSSSWEVIDVSPLDTAALKELVAQTEQKTLEDRQLSRVIELSGGNPFFFLELVGQCTFELDDELFTGEIERLISARLSRRTESETHVLEALAVAGHYSTPKLLANITGYGLQTIATASSSLYKTGIVYDEAGHLSFRHDLFTRYIYENMGELTRVTLHLLTAEYLEKRSDVEPATLARHYAKTEESGKALKYALDAASAAAERFAHEEALKLSNIALSHAKDKRSKNKALVLKAEAEYALGQLEAATETAETALSLDEMSPSEYVELSLLRGEALVERGKWRKAERVLGSLDKARVRSTANANWLAKLEWAKYLLLKAAVRSNNQDAAERLLPPDETLGTLQLQRDSAGNGRGATDVIVLQHMQIAAYNAFYGDINRAGKLVASVGSITSELPYDLRRQVFSLQALIANRLGNWKRAITINKNLIREASQFNDSPTLYMTKLNLAVMELERGNAVEAARIIQECLATESVDQGSNHTALVRTNLADQYFFMERYTDAAWAYEDALNLCDEYGFDYLIPELYAAYGLSLFAEGKVNQALEVADHVDLEDVVLGGVQDRYKIYWFKAYQMLLNGIGDPVKALQDYAVQESTTDIPSSRRLEWLARLFASEKGKVMGGEQTPSPKDAHRLKEIGLGWFAYHSRRWMTRVQSYVR